MNLSLQNIFQRHHSDGTTSATGLLARVILFFLIKYFDFHSAPPFITPWASPLQDLPIPLYKIQTGGLLMSEVETNRHEAKLVSI